MGYTKLERFLPKNQHTQRKLLNFEFWINGELSKIGVELRPLNSADVRFYYCYFPRTLTK